MPNISEALEKALNIAGNHSIILIWFLYLIGEIYGKIKEDENKTYTLFSSSYQQFIIWS